MHVNQNLAIWDKSESRYGQNCLFGEAYNLQVSDVQYGCSSGRGSSPKKWIIYQQIQAIRQRCTFKHSTYFAAYVRRCIPSKDSIKRKKKKKKNSTSFTFREDMTCCVHPFHLKQRRQVWYIIMDWKKIKNVRTTMCDTITLYKLCSIECNYIR